MKRIIVLTLPDTYMLGVSIAADVFRIADRVWQTLNPRNPLVPFEVKTAALSKRPVRCLGGTRIVPDESLQAISSVDLAIVPGITQYNEAFFKKIAPACEWLKDLHHKRIPIASFCTGSFVLAEAGLLAEKPATTHWAYERLFRTRYPDVKMQAFRLIVDEGDLISAGGANAGIDLCLYLIAKLAGKDLARRTAKILVHDLPRTNQAPYASFNFFEVKIGDEQVQTAKEQIESSYERGIDIERLSKSIGLGRRTFERKFKDALGETPLSYLQQVRIEAAKRMLEDGSLGFEEITSRVGYLDAGAFRKLFSKQTGLSPSAYRRKFSGRGFDGFK